MSRYQQRQILELTSKNVSYRKQAELLGVSKDQIYRLIRKKDTNNESVSMEQNDYNFVPSNLLDKFKGLSWLDFWQVLGPPLNKAGEPTDCWPYELQVIQDIEQYRRIAVNKAKAIGMTELILRYILYLCLSKQQQGNYVIVCGNTWEIARTLMRRIKAMLLVPHGISTDDRETVLTLPNCRIQAFSSEVNSFRGLIDVRFVLADEVDFLENSQDIRAVVDTYSVKSNAQIVLCSTPGQIDSTMYKLFKEPEPCLYHRITLNYNVAVGKLFTQEEIDHLKNTSPSFKREFECKWGYVHEGSSFTEQQLKRATSIDYSLDIIRDIYRVVGIDCGYTSGLGGGGAFGITITEYTDGIIKVMYSQTFKEVEHSQIVDKVVELMHEYNICKVFADGSAVGFIRSLKAAINEAVDYQRIIEEARHDKIDPYRTMKVCPVNFGTQHKIMMQNAKALMSDGLIAINKDEFPNLISALQTAKDRDNAYIKSEGLHTDEFDAFRLSLLDYQFGSVY